mmetsp:Transcript_65987/g.212857  ORF Transcript_65987/g.212857 Transcript_65987/m.212857 type:complete len:246 (+) Transcript_65987:65-802(+)
MGCSPSSFPADTAKFVSVPVTPVQKYLGAASDGTALVDRNGPVTLRMQRELWKQADQTFTVVKDDGTEICKVISQNGRQVITSMSDEKLAIVVHSVRYSEVNGVDASFNLPHVYIYAFSAYKDDQTPAEFEDGGKKLYYWGRVHKMAGSKPTADSKNTKKNFIASMANQKGTGGSLLEMFSGEDYSATMFPPDGNIAAKRYGKVGAVTASQSDENQDQLTVSLAANVDQAFAICMIIIMEYLSQF